MVGIGNFEEMKEDNDGGCGSHISMCWVVEFKSGIKIGGGFSVRHVRDCAGPSAVGRNRELLGMESFYENVILVKNKIGFIDGTCTREKYEADPFKLHQWDRCNAIVQSWIMSSVAQDLRKGIVYSSNAQKVWEAFKERFDKVNATKVYHMNREIGSLTQGILNISIYYSRLNDLWAEFESMIPFPGSDCVKSREFVVFLRQQKLMKFLMGLNDTYAPQRSQILMMNPTPTIDQDYSMLIQEES
ncbi:uncharacterized protein LOC142163794 [Nicotiana tabacum]|uniref:Uncharacterized protein LOC142163794 n=1 Tax=Nicotiana tabacum TaxID=4097 RepID=A0AC58RWN8_TOBAC